MPSAQDCAERLREQAYRTLLPQIRDLEQELQSVNSSLSSRFEQIQRKLESLRNIELPTTDLILHEILDEVIQQKDLEADAPVIFMRGLRRKETQEEILSFLLDSAQKYFPCIALFAVRGDRFIGWSSRGFPETLARSIISCSIIGSEYPQLQDALESEDPVPASGFPEDSPLQFMIESRPAPWSLISLKAMQRPVALLLAGGMEGAPNKPNVLTLMAGLVSMRLESIALKILHELTAAKPEVVASPEIEEAVAVPEPVLQTESFPQFAAAEPMPIQAPEPEPAPVIESVPEISPAQESVIHDVEAPVEAAEEAFSAPVIDQVEIPQPVPIMEPPKIEPQEVRPLPEEEKLHADAKRFARLLVSEIKLYNEKHVAEGRGNRDLYLRLKRDIDRSREMYEKRISPIVSRKIDYFHDEIIRILGDNDPSTLGSDYPGPRVES
jgi:hypothetical protein